MREAVSTRFLLHPGERLLWEGRPEKGLRFRGKDWLAYLACLTGLCLGAAFSKEGIHRFIFSLFLLMWIAVLLALVLSGPVWRAERCYAVTDERVIIVQPREVQSLPYREIYEMVKDFRKDGSGTIWFREPRKLNNYSYGLNGWKDGRRYGRYTYYSGVGFEEIADVERVYRLIEEQIRLHSQ